MWVPTEGGTAGQATYTTLATDSLPNAVDVSFKANVDNPGRRLYLIVRIATTLQLETRPSGNILLLR